MNDVAVIIPFYNRNKTIVRALNSIASQKGEYTVEIIIVDDASLEKPDKIITDWFNEITSNQKSGYVKIINVTVLQLETNKGPAAARNEGILKSNSKYVAFLDSDDEWLENSLDLRISALESNDKIKWIFCDFENYSEGICVDKSFMATRFIASQLKWQKNGIIKIPLNFFDCQLIQPLTQTSTLVVNREILSSNFLFDERLYVAEDWEFCLNLSSKHTPAYVDKVLVRRHNSSDGLVAARELWFEGNLKAAQIVLEKYSLSDEQRKFVKKRMAEDMYDWGYYLNSKGQYKEAAEKLRESLMWKYSWKTVKQLIKAGVKKLLITN